MRQFTGFPGRMQFTPIPNLFYSALLPQISDMAELKTTLHVFAAIYRKKGYPRFVTCRELQGDKSLMRSLGQLPGPPEPVLRDALAAATGRGTLLHLKLDRDGQDEDAYFLNDEPGRQAIGKIKSGELELPGLTPGRATTPAATGEMPDIFTIYEENIGMLTPMMAEELREAERLYPESWIQDAIKEAVAANKRNWRYIAAILERWSAEGKGSGTYQRDTKKADPDKYIKGRYGHMVQR